MTVRNRWTYLAIFVSSTLLGAVIFGVGQMTIDNFQCRSTKLGGDEFLAYCRSKQYGDYEHGALYYGSEPSLVANIRAAKVIFLGSSKTQAGFSSAALRAYFDKIDTRFFVMGFGYGEWSAFALAILKKWQASPKVIVINADPFFAETLSEPAKEALEGKPAFLWRLTMKMLFQRIHQFLCAVPSVCPETEPSIFRSTRDGQWNWIGPYIAEKAVPIDQTAQKTITREEFETAKNMGERFLQEIGLNRRCVVLTGTPNSDLDSTGIAKALAAELGTSSIFPPMDGLSTLEDSHLNLASAERWSRLFAQALTPILKDCAGG
jgi:hypothetical protein